MAALTEAEAAGAPAPQARGKGRVVRGERATTYVGATHFMAMLDDIEDLKAYFDDPEDAGDDNERRDVSPPDAGSAEQLLLLGGPAARAATKADLLALMPARSVVDRLIARYFASNAPTQNTLHRPSFARRYRAFWHDPGGADADFVALLFMIMALGVHFSSFAAPHELALDGTRAKPAERYRLYRAAAAAALSLAGFSSPSLRAIQALLMFAESEFLVNRATQTKCFLLLAVCIRLMLKMGLHRDPSRLPTISAFEGEMRRRLWNLAIQLDLIVSFYLGLPGMIHGIPSDTSLAHNLLDEDFDEDAAALPPARPAAEYTAMSYPIFKSMVCRVFGQVARLAHTLAPPTYAEVMRTDRALQERWRQIPAFMKVRPLRDCVADPPVQVVQRFGLASLYQKSRCVLHRPYLAEAVPRPEHAYSRRTCLQAALTLLAYNEAIHEAMRPGGLLHHVGWFITGLGVHDFLLAAMIVYLVVQHDGRFEADLLTSRDGANSASGGGAMRTPPSTGTGGSSGGIPTASSSSTRSTGPSGAAAGPGDDVAGADTGQDWAGADADADADADPPVAALPVERSRLIELLRRAHRIMADGAETNSDTVKAADLLSVMLRKIYARELRENASPPDWEPPASSLRQPSQPQPQPSLPSLPPQPLGIPPLSETAFGPGLQETLLGVPPASTAPASAPSVGAEMDVSPHGLGGLMPPLPAGAMSSMAAPSRYDSWIPLSLDALDWGHVDTGIRVVNSTENEWSADSNVLDAINYAAAGMWDPPDAAL